jgi:hypothetical protein
MISVMNELKVVTEKGEFNVVKAAPEKEADNQPGTNNKAKDGNDPANFEEPGNYYESKSNIGRQVEMASLANNVPQVNIGRKSINKSGFSDDEHGSFQADNATDHINITAYAQSLTENLKQPERAPAAAQTVQSGAGLTMIEEKVVDQAIAKANQKKNSF